MRIAMPPLKERRVIHRHLSAFFREHRNTDFVRAVMAVCRFYDVPLPRVEWFEWIGHGKLAGKTHDDGRIELVHPENWKKGRKYNGEAQWINAVLHELGHYYFFSHCEEKADAFAEQMERGVR